MNHLHSQCQDDPTQYSDESTWKFVKMSFKTVKTWLMRLVPLVLFFISFYYSEILLQSWQIHVPVKKTQCNTSISWERLGFNMSRNTHLFLKPKDFFWKKSSSSLSLPYGVKNSELFLLQALAAMTDYTMPQSVESLRCRTCVVVGNGFAIKNRSLGDTINTYDVVIRLNNSPVRGYEEDVGNRTTMRFFYPESASSDPSIDNEPDTIMVLVPFKQQDLLWLRQILTDGKMVSRGFWKPPPQIWLGKKSQIRILDPIFMSKTASHFLHIPIHEKAKYKQKLIHPTTGILAVFVALNYCNVVHLAGFGYPKIKDQNHPIHYFGNDTMKSMKNSVHDVTLEAQILKKLEDSGSIVYLHPHS